MGASAFVPARGPPPRLAPCPSALCQAFIRWESGLQPRPRWSRTCPIPRAIRPASRLCAPGLVEGRCHGLIPPRRWLAAVSSSPPLPSPPCLESRGRRQSRSISLASFEMSRVSRGSPPQKCNNRAWCCCEDSQSLSSLLPFHLGSQHWYLGNYRGCPSTAPFARGSPHRALFSPICLSRRDADASGCQQC